MAALHAGVNATAFIAHALAVPPPINLVTSPAGKYGISVYLMIFSPGHWKTLCQTVGLVVDVCSN